MSRIILCSGTRTNCPRTKYTPSCIAADEPLDVAPLVNSVTEFEPALKELITLSAARLSPFTKSYVAPATDAPVVPVALAELVAVVKYYT